MLKTDQSNQLSPTERLGRWGAAKQLDPQPTTGNMSVALARRLQSRNNPVTGPATGNLHQTLQSDSIEHNAAPAHPAAEVAQQPRQAQSPLPPNASQHLAVEAPSELGKVSEKLETILASVEFTEAYMAAGITKKISELVAKEVAVAERAAAQQARYRSRSRLLMLVILALAALLVAEAQYDFLAELSVLAAEQVQGLFQLAWAMGTSAVEAVSHMLS